MEEERCHRFFWRSLSHCLAVLEVESGGGGMINEFPDTEEESGFSAVGYNSERAPIYPFTGFCKPFVNSHLFTLAQSCDKRFVELTQSLCGSVE